MSRELIVIKESIDLEDNYLIEGIEVSGGNYKDASKFEIYFYSEGGYTVSSPRNWYDLIEEKLDDLTDTRFFKSWCNIDN